MDDKPGQGWTNKDVGMRINHNISAMVTQGSLFKTTGSLAKSLEKLSTGLRINSAADDAAGLGVSENLRTQVRGLKQALKNTQDAIAMLNIADGAMSEQADILQRMRELVIQAKNDTYTQTERAYMYEEFSQLMKEIDRIAAVSNYNGMMLFAAPEATGLDTNRRYSNDMPNGFDTGDFKTNHATTSQKDIWTDPGNSIFGDGDNSSAHHFNMMIGANWQEEDIAAFITGVGNPQYSVGDRGAADMITIQFGQMDAHAILTPNPATVGIFSGMGDANEIWDSFDMDIGTGFGDSDREDFWIDVLPDGSLDDSVGQKLNYLLQVIDGDPDKWDAAVKTNAYINNINVTGLERVNRMRSAIGAWTNRLEHAASNTMNSINNMQAAESLIRDADFASETSVYTKNAILTQSAMAMLAQANVSQQSVLQLLG